MKKIDFKSLNVKIVEKFKIFAPIALAIILAGVIVMIAVGMNVGIDFTGGTVVKVDFDTYTSLHADKVDDTVKDIKDFIADKGFTVSQERWSGDDRSVLELGLSYELDGKKVTDETASEYTDRVDNDTDGLLKELQTYVQSLDVELEDVEISGNTVGASAKQLLKNAIVAVIVAVIVMLVYIMIRFTVASGLSAIICLCHDVLIMLALTTIFRVQVTTTFIAAIITIIGYSINATIVIFDRIRETSRLASMKGVSDSEIANTAIRDTLGRSIITTLTTLITVVALAVVCAVMGIATMQEFVLPIIFGLIGGTYSSIFLSSSVWVYLRKLGAKIKKSK